MGYNFKKIAAMAIISMAVVLSITGCNQNADEDSVFHTLDIEQLETDTTDINDRAEYYDKNVDDRIDEMTDEEKEKLGGVEAGANKNLIEIIKLAGAALNISEKAVDIPLAGETAGVVTSSTEENKVAVAEDGSMEVNSLNMNKLVQSEGDTLILDGGNASV